MPVNRAIIPTEFSFSFHIKAAPNVVKRIMPIFVVGYTIIARNCDNAINKKTVLNTFGMPNIAPLKNTAL